MSFWTNFRDNLLGPAAVVGASLMTGGAAAATAPFLTAAGSAITANRSAAQSQASARASAQAQMDFQREMSNTSYQRALADLQAAGLNPMLAYSQGGASSASGAGSAYDYSGTASNAIEAARNAISFKEMLKNNAVDRANRNADTLNKAAMLEQIKTIVRGLEFDNISKSNAAAASAFDVALKKASLRDFQARYDFYVERGQFSKAHRELAEFQRNWIAEHPNAYSIGQYGSNFGSVVGLGLKGLSLLP